SNPFRKPGRHHDNARDTSNGTPEKKEDIDPESDPSIEIVDWEAPDDLDNPSDWSVKRKWLITITTCFISILTGLPAGAYGAGNAQMSQEFDVALLWWRSFIGDKERSILMSIFGMTSVVGIALGPFIGGAIQRNSDWRWIYYIQLAFDRGCLLIFYLILKETREDVSLRTRAKKLREEGKGNAYVQSEIKKTSTVVFSFTLWISLVWGILFIFQSSVLQTFTANYGFATFQTGLIQLAISAGAVTGTVLNPIQDRLYLQSKKRNKEGPSYPIPEARLYFSVLGSLLFSAGLFWYGWSSYPDVPWIVPTLGNGCVGLGICEVYMTVVSYLANAYE
ncbi:hypothetical protein LTS18_007787, partial [Coniosporium uncinatum]